MNDYKIASCHTTRAGTETETPTNAGRDPCNGYVHPRPSVQLVWCGAGRDGIRRESRKKPAAGGGSAATPPMATKHGEDAALSVARTNGSAQWRSAACGQRLLAGRWHQPATTTLPAQLCLPLCGLPKLRGRDLSEAVSPTACRTSDRSTLIQSSAGMAG